MLSRIIARVLSRVAFLRNSPAILSAMLLLAISGCGSSSMGEEPPALLSGATLEQGVTYWPITLEATEGQIEVYQPQPQSLKGDMLSARAAVSLTRPGATAPVFGAAWFSAHVATDRDMRMVTIRDVTVKEVRLPGSTPAEQQDFARAITGRLTAPPVAFPQTQPT